MQIQESVEICVTRKYADFNGCATRSEYWWFVLFLVVINALLGIAAQALAGAFALAMLVPYVAVGTRRLRDIGRSPWWWAIILLPVAGAIVLVVFFSQKGATPTTPT